MIDNEMLKIKQIEGLREALGFHFAQTFNDTTDWTFFGGLYKISFTHNLNSFNLAIEVWDHSSGTPTMVLLESIEQTSKDVLTIRVPGDSRFAGRVVINGGGMSGFSGYSGISGYSSTAPIGEILLGAGVSTPSTSTANLTYNITDGLFVGSGGLTIFDFAGSGNQMVVVDNNGIFSTQAIPATAALTTSYVGYGGLDGIMTGSSNLTYSIATGLTINSGDVIANGAAASHRLFRINIPEDSGTAGGLLVWSSGNNETYFRRSYDSGNLDGTSIPYYHNSILSSKKSGAQFNGEITIGGGTIYNIVGTTSSNYGTRLDAVGLKIGILSTLHTTNEAPLQIGSGLYASDSKMSIGAVLTGGYNGAYGTYNSRGGGVAGLDRHFVGESALNSTGIVAAMELRNYSDATARFANYSNVAGTSLSGTSIDLARALRIDNTLAAYSSGFSANGKIIFTGSEIFGIVGTTATNIGTRLDSTGLRIGRMSSLHTANDYVFSVFDSIERMSFRSSGTYMFGDTATPYLVLNHNTGTVLAYGAQTFQAYGTGLAMCLSGNVMFEVNAFTNINVKMPMNFAIGSEQPFTIKSREASVLYAVPMITPNTNNQVIGFNVMPKGSPTESSGNGYAWIDVFDVDASTSNPARTTARIGNTSSYVEFGSRALNGGTLKPLALTLDGIPHLTVTSGLVTVNGEAQVTSLAGTGDRMVEADSNGVMSAATEIVDGWLSDETAIALITDPANWSVLGVYTGVSLTGTYQGQEHYDDNYFYKFVADNNPIRMPRG